MGMGQSFSSGYRNSGFIARGQKNIKIIYMAKRKRYNQLERRNRGFYGR